MAGIPDGPEISEVYLYEEGIYNYWLYFPGTKRKIADFFTFSKLGFSQLLIERSEPAGFADAEVGPEIKH